MNITDDYEGFNRKTDFIDDENANIKNIPKYLLLSTPSGVLLLSISHKFDNMHTSKTFTK